MKANLRASLDAMGRDFDREINSAYAALQIGGAMLDSGDWSTFEKQWERWSASAIAPTIVQSVWLVEAQRDASLRMRRFERSTRSFQDVPLPVTLASIEPLLARQLQRPTIAPTVVAEPPAIISPIVDIRLLDSSPSFEPPIRSDVSASFIRARGAIVIAFDDGAIRNELLPRLMQRYFPRADYDVAVVAREPAQRVIFGSSTLRTGRAADATRDIFALEEQTLRLPSRPCRVSNASPPMSRSARRDPPRPVAIRNRRQSRRDGSSAPDTKRARSKR